MSYEQGMSKEGKIQLAREFRKNPTRTERIMWNALRNRQFLNLKFRRQYLIEGYLVDFYCHELKLAVEIDGSVHGYEDQINKDVERQKIIITENLSHVCSVMEHRMIQTKRLIRKAY